MKTKKISLWFLSLIFSLSMIFAISTTLVKKKSTQIVKAENTYKFAYLSDLSVKSMDNVGEYAINTTLNPNDVLDGAITLKRGGGAYNERYSKAITINRTSGSSEGKIVYDLTGLNATRFTAIIGVNQFKSDNQWANRNTYPNTATASFKVYGDGRELFNDAKAYNPDSVQGAIDVNITGVKELTLASYDVGTQDIMCEHAVFANPRIYGENLTVGQEANFLYLSDFPYSYKDYQDYYDNFSINQAFPLADGSLVPLALKVDGATQTFEKGLCFQANCKYGWDISGTGAYRLTGLVGINQRDALAYDREGTVVVKINYRMNGGDDVNLKTTDVLTRNTDAIPLDINIPYGASNISIVVEDGGDGNAFDNATLADLKLYCDYAYLSDMTTSATDIGFGDLLNDTVLEGKSTLFNVITEPSVTHSVDTYFDKCVFMHASSSAEYDVSGMNATVFSAFVGIVSTKTANYVQNATFNVKASSDGTNFTLLQALTMSRTDQMGRIQVNIPANTVKIRVETSTSNTNSAHTVYCMPRVFANTPYATRAISLTSSNDSLKVGETANISLYSCSYGSIVKKASNASFSISSNNTGIVTVDDNAKTIKAVGEGEAIIETTYTEGSVTISTNMKVLVGSASSNANKQMELASPDGNTKLIVTLNNSWIDYSAVKNGKLFVEKSRIGLNNTSLGDFTNGFTYRSMTSKTLIDETYKTYSGKFLSNRDYCYEQSITFAHGSDLFTVVGRAYNDGVAFRYIIQKADGGEFTVTDEDTQITIPFFSRFYSCVMPDTTGKTYTHEQTASETMISQFGGLKTIPFMYKTPDGLYCLMTEADLTGNYWGSCVTSIYTKTMKLNHSAQQTGAVTLNGQAKLPWRVFIAGTLEEVIKSQMVENVATRADTSGTDWDWVEAGVTAWSWMSGLNAPSTGNWFSPTYGQGYQGNPEAIKKYIDLAAEMGWKYFIMDEGWQPWVAKANKNNVLNYTGDYDREEIKPGYQNFDRWYEGVYDWMTSKSKYWTQGYESTVTYTAGSYTGEKIIDYANRKGVKLIAWLHTGICDTPTRMDRVFSMLQDIGIAGIKIDFFDSENQATMEIYQELYQKTAQYHLLGNFHGSNKPSGERVTYPNVTNREAINGEENNNTRINQHSILAYVRGTVGPTDLTPYVTTVGKGDTNMASQMAFSVIYESGMTCFASTADEYLALSDDIKYYYRNFPGRWADLKLLSGEVGENMSIARKTADGKWYIGSISETSRTDTFSLDFLDSGENYIAHVYTDKADRKSVDCEIKTLKSTDTLSLSQRANGGYVVVLVKESAEKEYDINKASVSNGTISTNVSSAKQGDIVTVSATPNEGYELVSITVDGKAISGNTFTMPASDVTVSATFRAIEYTITTASVSNGTLNTNVSKATKGTTVTVTATPSAGYKLASITVNGTVISGNTFTMPASAVTVSATFTAIEYTITTASVSNGTLSTNVSKATIGTMITVTATPSAGYELESITVNGTAISGNTFTMPAGNVTVSATFKAIEYTITHLGSVNGKLIISATKATVGQTITITTIPDEGYVLQEIKLNGKTFSGTSFTMPAHNVTIGAIFKAIEYTVTTASVSNGTLSVDVTKAAKGTTVTVTATANTGYKLASITVNGSAISGNTFTMPAGDVTVGATFVAEEYSITVNTDGNGSATASLSVAKIGDLITIAVTPNENYELDKVLVNGSAISGLSFTMPADSVTVTVSFKLKQQTSSSSSSEESSSSSSEESSSSSSSSIEESSSSSSEITSSESSSSSKDSQDTSSSSSSSEISSSNSSTSASQTGSSSSYKPAKKGGCNASVASSLGLLPLCLIAFAIIVFLKKRND